MLGYQMRCGTKCMIVYVKTIMEHGRSLNSDNFNIQLTVMVFNIAGDPVLEVSLQYLHI